MDNNNNAVDVKGLNKNFGAFQAVKNMTFHVEKGEIFGFLGPNGAGKSTTIRMLCGILRPTSGEGRVGGYDIYQQTEEIKGSIGYMSQKFSLYDDLTVQENIDFFNRIYNVPDEKKGERKEWVLKMAGLEEKKDERTVNLSGGFKQRLALGCAILHEPPILFLDEPTSGIDPITRDRFWDLIYSLADKGVTVFVTTHNMEEAEYFHRIGFIYRGELVALDTPSNLKEQTSSHNLEEVFINLIEEYDKSHASLSEVTQ